MIGPYQRPRPGSVSPCFVNCGEPACEKLGCIIVYNAEERARAQAACTGIGASWCPVHGDCTCPRNDDGEALDGLDDPSCPLHSLTSRHGDGR